VGGLRAWADYAHGTRGDYFAWWSSEYLVQGADQWAGKPLVLEEWQAAMMNEALAVDEDARPYWRTVVLIVPRKAGKTSMLGAYADFELDNGEGEPEILLAAGSDKQAGRLYGACAGFVRRSPGYLAERMIVREYVGEIARMDGAGKVLRLSSEGDTLHGYNPSLVVADELHVWRTPKLLRAWGALTTADAARRQAQVFAITTEGAAAGGERSVLGQVADGNEARGDLERKPGLTISRDHDARTLVYRYHAVDAKAADPRPLRRAHGTLRQMLDDHGADAQEAAGARAEVERLERKLLDSVAPANPASWVTEEYLLEQARSSKVLAADFLQLHANVASDARDTWIPGDRWQACEDRDAGVPDEATITIAVDASISHDTTCVAWAYRRFEDDRVIGRCHVWGAREEAPHHELVPGGRIRFEPVEAFIIDLARRYNVDAVRYDPRFFEQSATRLSDEGLLVVVMNQGSAPMRDAEQAFHDLVVEERFVHDGDAVLAAHVAATVAEQSDRGWRIRKLRQSAAIDATVAMVMAVSGALAEQRSVYEERGLLVI
jgi:phage terminase large subunit-like protein